ncbi:matrixin family metalloprotease, partial [Pseudomonas chlororaphis]|nr:matrixin family metalloprotease [Pseudomonas chlororaphis]
VDATGDTLSVQGNDTVQGTSDLLYLGGNETVSTSGSGMTVETSANDVVAGSGDTVNVGGNLLAGQSAGVTTLEGIGDKVYASTDTLDIGGSTTATVVGSDDLIGILGSGSTINASSDTFQAINGVKDTIVGSHDVINDGLNDTITEMGTYDTTIGNSSDTTEHMGTDTGDTDSGDRPANSQEPDTNDPTTNPIEPSDPNHGNDDSGGDLGFAGSKSTILSTTGSNIGFIARYVLSQDNQAAAVAAEKGLQQARDMAMTTPTVGNGSAVLEGAQFDQQVITWSLADSQGTQATPFSGYMGSADESVVQGVFNTWAASMPGVTFEEVSDSAQSDIRVGFGDFNTATTGIIGYTSYQANDGQIAPDAIVRVEDPTQNALTTGADGQQAYVGTEATLSQVLLHEIGHALGLGDNADQNSVMNYQLTASNRTLDRTDLVGIGSLYGTGASTTSVGGTGVSQLIQAMSTFNADTGVADTTLLPPALLNNNVILSASAHAA